MNLIIDELLEDQEVQESPLYKSWVEQAIEIRSGEEAADLPMIMYKTSHDEGDGRSEDFTDEELLMAATIGAAVAKQGKKIEELIGKTLSIENVDRFPDAVLDAQQVMQATFTPYVEDKVSDSIDLVLRRGGRVGGAEALLRESISRDIVRDGILNSTKYYTNNYFNNHVVPVLYKQVDLIVAGDTAASAGAFKELRENLAKRLKSTPYWRVVSNGAMSRGYHYGVLRSAQMAGFRGYQLQAVLDDRTSDICRSLNGKQFWISDAVNHLEQVATALDPNDLKVLDPWVKADDVAGKDSQALKNDGVLTPPFHANCRTTVELLS